MSGYHKPDVNILQELKDVSNKLRILSVKATSAANSGHPTSCASMAEIMSVLFFHTMRYKVSAPRDPSSDRFILSKGHAAPILYAAWCQAGLFPEADLMKLREIDTDLEGHPTPRLDFIDVATGSLGQGLSVGCGMAYVGKYYDKANYKVFCLIGDGESAEGSIWEALNFAAAKKLNNLVAIFDINRLGQSDPTYLQHNMDEYKARLKGFGFDTYVVDGHDIEALCKAFHEATQSKDKPSAILAKTYKGQGFVGIEDKENWHGKPLGAKADEVIAGLQAKIKNPGPPQLVAQKPLKDDAKPVDITNISLSSPPSYNMGQKVATRQAYGTALAKLAQNNARVIAMDGDTKNSTFSNAMLQVDPQRYIECYIAEQNLVGVGIGAACRDRSVVFCSTFAAFFTRAFDQLRMGAISQTNLNCVGSHCGVSIGEDGPSQMALEDLALFRSIPTATVFYPSDAVSTERACELAANTKGICFIRTSRPATEIIYGNEHHFEIGKCNVVLKSPKDKALVIGSCVTLQEALKAAKTLSAEGINIRVIDPFTIKPLDKKGVIQNAQECGGNVIVVEDHYPEGGIGEAVMSAVSLEKGIIVKHLAVRDVPRSGKSAQLMEMFGICDKAIASAVKQILSA